MMHQEELGERADSTAALSGNIASGLDPAQNPTYRSQPAAASGGKARNTAFPNAAMFSQTIIIAHSSVMPNWPRPPLQEIQPKPPVYLGEWGGEFGITSRRLHVSLPAPSPGVAKAKFRAFPPLVLRCSSGRPRVETLGQTGQS